MKKTILPSVLAFLLMSSFSHQNGISIQILSPTEKSVFSARDTIWIKAEVKSQGALHNVNVKVISLKDSSVLFNKNIHTHGANAGVKEFFINPLIEKTNLKLSIQTSDHSGQETGIQTLNFSTADKKKAKKG